MLAAVVLLSLGDLWMTLLHLRAVGMLEGNPIARLLIIHGTSAGLIAWKVASVSLAIFILYATRRQPAAEVGALICCCILTWLTHRWIVYSDHLSHLTRDLPSMVASEDGRWVSLPDGM